MPEIMRYLAKLLKDMLSGDPWKKIDPELKFKSQLMSILGIKELSRLGVIMSLYEVFDHAFFKSEQKWLKLSEERKLEEFVVFIEGFADVLEEQKLSKDAVITCKIMTKVKSGMNIFPKPKWYSKLPASLKPIDDGIIHEVENFRKENYLTDELMFMAIGTTKWAVRKIQKYILEQFKETSPHLTEKELWVSVIYSRLQVKLAFCVSENVGLHESDPFVKPLSEQEIYSLIENLDKIISKFKTFEDVIKYIIEIDEKENRFHDGTGLHSKLSELLENSS